MSRGLSSENSTAAGERVVRPVIFCDLDFADGAVRVHNGIGSITWDSKTWLGVGSFGGLGETEEGVDVAARDLSLSLNSIPSDVAAQALAAEYTGRSAKLWLGFRDASDVFVAEPFQFFGGRISTMTVVDFGESSSITVQCESRLADLRRARISRLTHEEQIRRHPGDLAFAFVANLANAPIYWGIGKQSPSISATTYKLGGAGV